MAARISRRELLALACTPALAQFTSSVRVVNVYVTVRDRRGELVRGLKKEDFELAEEGRRQPIRYFSSDSDAPLAIGLLFDISGSQRTLMDQQRASANAFLNQVLRKGDTSFFAAFDREFRVLPIDAPLDAQRPESKGTALFDALIQAAQHVEPEPGRKVLIVLTDGIDTASSSKLPDAIQAAHRVGASIFPIHFYDDEVFRFLVPGPALDNLRAGRAALDRMARETGGAVLENFNRIQQELRSQYSLGFSPGSGKAGYRKLRVQLKQRGLTAQARDGYFAAE